MGIEQARDPLVEAASLVASVDVSGLDAAGVTATVDRVARVRAQVSRLDIALAARAGELRGAEVGSCDDPVDLLVGVGAMPSGRAKQVVRHAVLLARMPELKAALDAGSVGEGHVEVVANARRRVDPAARCAFDGCDAEITRHATAATPDALADRLRPIVRRLERSVAAEAATRARRRVRVSTWVDKQGDYRLSGTFDVEMGARIVTAIDVAVEGLRKNPAAVLPGDDPKDPLGCDREFLAAHALARLVSHGHDVEHPGVAEIVVIVDETTMRDGEHDATVCELVDGTPVDVSLVGRLCCEAIVTAVVVTPDGTVPLCVGREQRTATRAQRRALRAIHRTCAVAGCAAPFGWCEIHHVRFWEHGGLTDIDNLVPLCLRHHHLVHDCGWRLELEPRTRLLTFVRPDGSIHSQATPDGLRPMTGPPPGTASTTAA